MVNADLDVDQNGWFNVLFLFRLMPTKWYLFPLSIFNIMLHRHKVDVLTFSNYLFFLMILYAHKIHCYIYRALRLENVSSFAYTLGYTAMVLEMVFLLLFIRYLHFLISSSIWFLSTFLLQQCKNEVCKRYHVITKYEILASWRLYGNSFCRWSYIWRERKI